jgi:chaperonin GroES
MKNKTNTHHLQPLGDRVLVRPAEAEGQIGLIVIPEGAKERPQEATVVALGTGARDERGNIISFEVKVGDRVITSKYCGTEITIGGEKLQVTSAKDILAVIE